MKRIVFIGAGNLATNLAKEMSRKGYDILQVYSRTEENARILAEAVSARFTSSLQEIDATADLYIFSVKDAVLLEVIEAIKPNAGLWVHTAGSIPMDIFKPYTERFGVFYPLQSFSKNRLPDFREIPFFIEANRPEDCDTLLEAAHSISSSVYRASSDQRKYLHLAAVFANNFTNHLFAIASRLVEENGLPFDALKPLIKETAAKIEALNPLDAQTGPAVRYDENIMNKQLDMLKDEASKEIYRLLSSNIHEYSKNR